MSSFNQSLNQKSQFIIAVKVIKCPTDEQYINEEAQALITGAKPRRALIDTGATNTCITQEFVDELGLIPVAQQSMMTAGEPCEVNQYQVDIAIPVTTTALQAVKENGKETMRIIPIGEENWGHAQHKVNAIPSVGKDRGFEVILGMDILSKMHITMFAGQIIMSF